MEVCKERDKDHSTSTPFSQYKSIYSYLIVPGIDLLQVDFLQVLKCERSELRYMRSHSDGASDEVSWSTCFA